MNNISHLFGLIILIIAPTLFCLGGVCLLGKNGRPIGGVAFMLISVAIIYFGMDILKQI